MSSWDEQYSRIEKQKENTSWEDKNIDENILNKLLMQNLKDEQNYTKEDRLWNFAQEGEKPKYVKQEDMGIIDSARASFADTAFSKEVNKLFGLHGNEPDVEVIDGKRYKVENKIFNDMDKEELDNYISEQISNESNNQNDKVLYAFRKKEIDGTDSIKYGIAKNSFEDRYKDQPEVLQNNELLFQKRLSNAEEVEKKIHGSKWARENRVVDFGKGNLIGSGATEYYHVDEKIKKLKKQTPESAKALDKIQSVLTPRQKEIQNFVLGDSTGNIEDSLTMNNLNIEGDMVNVPIEISNDLNKADEANAKASIDKLNEWKSDKSSKTTEQFIDELKKKDESSGALNASGAIDEYSLTLTPQYQDSAEKLSRFFRIKENASPFEKAQQLNKELSMMNGNITQFANRIAAISQDDKETALALSNAIEMYDSTDLDINQVGRGLKAIATDPTTLMTLGGNQLFKKAGIESSKKGLLQYLKKITSSQSMKAGALEGGVYSGAFDAGKQSVNIKAEKQKELDTYQLLKATGTGVVIGGALGKIIDVGNNGDNPKINRTKLLERKSEVEIEISKEKDLKKRRALKKEKREISIVEKELESGKTDEEIIKKLDNGNYLKIDNEERLRILNEYSKEEIKPKTNKVYSQSKKKKVEKQNGKEFLDSHSKDENFKFELTDNVIGLGEDITPKNRDIGELQKRIIKFKKNIQASGRKDDTGYLLSPQSTVDDVSALKILSEKPLRNKDDLTDYINEYMNIHDEQVSLESQYGSNETKFRKENYKTDKQKYVNKMNEEKKILKSLRKEKELPLEVKKDIAYRLDILNSQKVEEYKVKEETKQKAKKNFIENNDGIELSQELRTKDEVSMLEDYEALATQRKKRGYYEEIDNPNKTKEEIQVDNEKIKEAITEKIKESELDIAEKSRLLRKKLTLDGVEQWDGKITEEILKRYPQESKSIIRNIKRKKNIEDKTLSTKELRYREERLLQEELQDMTLSKEAPELKKQIEEIHNSFEKIGLKSRNKKKRNVSIKTNKKKEKTEINQETQLEIDKKIQGSEARNQNAILNNLEYSKTGRYKSNNSGKEGQLKITKKQQEYLDTKLFSNREIAEAFYPVRKGNKPYSKEEFRQKQKELFEKMNEKIYKDRESKLGITESNRKKSKRYIRYSDTIKDASNSVLQIVSVLTKSRNMGSRAKLTGGSDDIRIDIGRELNQIRKDYRKELSPKENDSLSKELVKKLFMIEPYGARENKLVQTVMEKFPGIYKEYGIKENITKDFAEKYVQDYYKATDKMLPELKRFSDAIYKKMEEKGFNGTIEYTLPTGFKVKINLKKIIDGKIKVRGKTIEFSLSTKQLDRESRALMPILVQSIDAMIAHKMQLKGYPTNHDAFRLISGRKESQADRDYSQILSEILNSNLLENIEKQLGISKTKPIERNKQLTKIDIYNSKHKLGTEHLAGNIEESKERKVSYNYIKSEEEILRDFMAKDNHRQIPTYSLIDKMVNEASIRDMSRIYRKSDIYETQLANAHTSSDFNKGVYVKPPEGIDKKKWKVEQEKIFNEFRAKLEYNSLMNKTIRGRRKFFNANNELIHNNSNPLAKQIEIEHKLAIEEFKKRTSKKNLIASNREKKIGEIKRWKENKELTPEQMNEYSLIENVKNITTKKQEKQLREELKDIVKIEKNKKRIGGEYRAYFERQLSNEGKYGQFNELNNMVQSTKRIAERKKEGALKYWIKKIPKEENDNILKHVLHTDYAEIYGMTQLEANNFIKKYNHLYTIAKDSIDDMSSAIGRRGNQTGYFFDNADYLADFHNLDKNDARIIDKIISIKAMSKESWDYIEKNMNKNWFKAVIENRTEDKKKSKKLFEENQENYVKGWIKDIYDERLSIDDSGEVILNTDTTFNHTAIVADLENKSIGTKLEDAIWKEIDKSKYDIDNDGKIKLTIKSFNQARLDNIKITGKKDRAVAGREIREKLNRSKNVAEILSETSASIEEKESRRTIIEKTLNNDYGLLFSNTEKEGMKKLTELERQSLPYRMRDKVKYADKELYRQLIVSEKARIFKINDNTNQTIKIIDKTWVALGKRFKQNVVLKNIPSFKNAFLFNYSIAISAGINPIKIAKYQKEAIKQRKIDISLMEEYAGLNARGKHEEAKKIKAKLVKSELFQMEMQGLATNVLEGVKAEKDILSIKLKNKALDVFFDNILMNQNSKTGKFTTEMFSMIDTVGRYSMVKGFEEQGFSRKDAILKANGILGDLDQIAPVAIQLLDDYGGAYFMKWFTQTAPSIMKVTKENPSKTIAIAIGIYALSQQMEKHDETKDKWGSQNLSGINPVESYLDYTEMQFGKWTDKVNTYKRGGAEELAIREISPHFVPNVILKPILNTRMQYKIAKKKNKQFELNISRIVKNLIAPNRGAKYDFKTNGESTPLDTRGYSQEYIESIFQETINNTYKKGRTK